MSQLTIELKQTKRIMNLDPYDVGHIYDLESYASDLYNVSSISIGQNPCMNESISIIHKILKSRAMTSWRPTKRQKTYHEFHETCHSVTFIVLVNSHQI